MWHNGLIYKLYDLRLPLHLLRYIISFLDQRTALVEIENTLSRSFTLKSGTLRSSPPFPLIDVIKPLRRVSTAQRRNTQHSQHKTYYQPRYPTRKPIHILEVVQFQLFCCNQMDTQN